MEGKNVFESLIKIMNRKIQFNDNEILRKSTSMDFIKIKVVDKKDLPKLVEDLKSLIERLDDALVIVYRQGAGP